MHIPDGYLSPETAAVMYAAALPFWYRATRKIKTLLTSRRVPMIALFAAFSFVVMMFNVPLPGGTTGHAVGSSLAAIVLGPWAAVLAVSVALIIQAFFFGDGGILAIGANVFNMAIAMSFVATFVFRALRGKARPVIAAAIAGYCAINVSALLAAIELGLQPVLFHDAHGHSLYFPYDLTVSIPAMMLGHLTIAGAVEASVTGFVFAWLARTNPELIESFSTTNVGRGLGWAWGAVAALIVLTPIGLLAPGTAWGEWGRDELQNLGLGYIPAGYDQFSNVWRAPLADYTLPSFDANLGYVLSALLGIAAVALVVLALGWIFGSRQSTRGFVEKTLGDITNTLEQTLFAEAIARDRGLLQSLDPRAKLLGTLAVLIAISASQNLVIISALYLLTLPFAFASRIPMGFYLKRVWLFMPFFTGIVALPALFNVFSPGAPLLTLIDIPNPPVFLAVTLPGVVTAAFLLMRVGASVSVAVLLILTTRWATLLKALRVLHVPQAFVLILGMTYRYIYVLLHAASNVFLARQSRVVGHVSLASQRGWLMASIGNLFSKSYALSDDVYLAMQARGFRGEAQIMEAMLWRGSDWFWLGLFLAIAATAIWLGR